MGLLATIIQFFNPLRNLDITVVADEKAHFALPAAATALDKLKMTYDGQPIQNISVVRLTVINAGREPIEPPDSSPTKEWILTFRSSNNLAIEKVGELTRTPRTFEHRLKSVRCATSST